LAHSSLIKFKILLQLDIIMHARANYRLMQSVFCLSEQNCIGISTNTYVLDGKLFLFHKL
jgi:hypothetical protein